MSAKWTEYSINSGGDISINHLTIYGIYIDTRIKIIVFDLIIVMWEKKKHHFH